VWLWGFVQAPGVQLEQEEPGPVSSAALVCLFILGLVSLLSVVFSSFVLGFGVRWCEECHMMVVFVAV